MKKMAQQSQQMEEESETEEEEREKEMKQQQEKMRKKQKKREEAMANQHYVKPKEINKTHEEPTEKMKQKGVDYE